MTAQWITTPEGTDYNQSQGFIVRSIRVDNLSASWLYCADANYYIPPYYYGVVFNIGGNDAPLLQWKTPPTIMPNPVGKGQARFEYFDATQTPSSGMLVYNQSQIAQVLGTFTPSTVGVLEPPVTLPAGTLELILIYPIAVATVTLLEGRGVQSGGIYPGLPYPTSVLGLNPETVYTIPVFYGGPDTQIRIFHNELVNSGTAFIVALFAPLTPTVEAIIADNLGPITVNNPLPVGSNANAPVISRIEDGTTSTLAVVTAGNALKVDGSAVTQPVSGTVTADAANGSGAITPSNPLDVQIAKLGGITSGNPLPVEIFGNGLTSGTPIFDLPAPPSSSNILGGSVAALNGGPSTIITIPSGRTWKGTVGCTTTGGVVAAIKAANGTGTSTPASGTLLAQTDTGPPAVSEDIYVSAAGGTALITATTSGANGDFWANGVLL